MITHFSKSIFQLSNCAVIAVILYFKLIQLVPYSLFSHNTWLNWNLTMDKKIFLKSRNYISWNVIASFNNSNAIRLRKWISNVSRKWLPFLFPTQQKYLFRNLLRFQDLWKDSNEKIHKFPIFSRSILDMYKKFGLSTKYGSVKASVPKKL